MTISRTLMWLSVAALAGCTVIVDGRIEDNDTTVNCAVEDDGVSCGPDAICLDGACTPSRCGDMFIDPLRGEDCEDNNLATGDGCEPGSCTFTCTEAANCSDGDPCNGAEVCTASNRCEAGTPPTNGTESCTRDDASAGTCVSGLCAPAGCGDNVVDAPEECDEMSAGCLSDCTWACENDDDCSDSSVCTGTETCDVGTHTCQPGTPISCDDGEVCTADSCDAVVGCEYALADDDDSDGVSEQTCTNPMGGAVVSGVTIYGNDCDDTNDQISPLRPEQCDAIDHDCDGNAMNAIVNQNYYRDADGDGYPNMLDKQFACQAPAGYTLPRADAKWDCADNQPDRHPRSTSDWFEDPTCTISGAARYSCLGVFPTLICAWRCPTVTGQTNSVTYDWSCDNVATQRYTSHNSTGCTFTNSGGFFFCTGAGWTGATPACGVSASYRTCGVGPTLCGAAVANRIQSCQ